MKKLLAAVAIAAAFFVVLPAAAQTVSDPSTGAVLQAPMPAPGAEFSTSTPFTPDGTAEFNWGDHLITLANGLSDLIIPILLGIAVAVYNRVTGKRADVDDAARFREYMKSAYDFAVNAVAPAARGRKLTINEASPVVEWMLHYADELMPSLVEKFGGRESNRLRSWAIVDLAQGEAIPLVSPGVRPVAAPSPSADPAPAPAAPAP